MRLGEIMTTDLFTVDPETTLQEAASILVSEHIGGVPVLSGGRLVGVLSVTDILEFEASPPGAPLGPDRSTDQDVADTVDPGHEEAEFPGTYFVDDWRAPGGLVADRLGTVDRLDWNQLAEYTVSDVMTRTVFSLPPDTTVRHAAARMLEADVHRVLVMEHEELLGLVSSRDVLRAVAERGLGRGTSHERR